MEFAPIVKMQKNQKIIIMYEISCKPPSSTGASGT